MATIGHEPCCHSARHRRPASGNRARCYLAADRIRRRRHSDRCRPRRRPPAHRARRIAGRDQPGADHAPPLRSHRRTGRRDFDLFANGTPEPLRLYGPPETRRIVETLLGQIYDKDIEFRVREAGNVPWPPTQTTDILSGLVCEGDGWRITAEVVDHGSRLDFPEAFRQRWVCLGYRFECAQGVIAFSGDTVDCPGLRRLAADANVLVLCCYLSRSEINSPAARRLADYTLACADTVGRIAHEAGVGTLCSPTSARNPRQ